MGKKRQRASQTSKGIHCQKRTPEEKQRRIEYRQSGQRMDNQLQAFLANKNVMLTIANPDQNNTRERFIRVPAREVWKR